MTRTNQFRAGTSPEELFWAKVYKSPDCWLWMGARNQKGYGNVARGGGSRGNRQHLRAHRVAWELTNGAIPADLIVCHRCDNPACVRPDHLFLGTHQDNANDMVAKGRGRWQKVAPDGTR